MQHPEALCGSIERAARLTVTEKFDAVGLIKNADLSPSANIDPAKMAQNSNFGMGQLMMARAKYDFAVDGGAQGEIVPATNVTLPDNAVIVGATINSTTAVTSGGAATVSVGTHAGSSATSLLGATGKASLGADALVNGAATFAAPVKMSAAGQINITVGTADLTAGVIEITVFYFIAAA